MTSNDVERVNERARPLGYEVQHVDGGFYLHRIDEPGRMHASTVTEVEDRIYELESSDHWRLDLYSGSVDYDTIELVVSPRDGSQPYHLREVDGHSGSNNGRSDGSGANYLYVNSTDRPIHGGAWHKWTGSN
jgi:hypothetical protein